MSIAEWYATKELMKAINYGETPIAILIKGIERKIRQCELYFRHKFESEEDDEDEPSCASIVAAIKDREADDRRDFGCLQNIMDEEEESEYTTVGSFIALVDLYIQRGRLRRKLVQETEAAVGKVVMPKNSDHYMIDGLEGEGMGTLARLLARHGYDDPQVQSTQEAQETKVTSKAENDKDDKTENE